MDISDLSRFATVVPRLCTKKGYLHEVKRGNELEKGFYCLFGNLLYVFDSETDVNSVRGLVFLESSTCKVTNNVTPLLSISTVGGRTINFTASDITDLYEWLNAVEASKLVNMNRKVEDSETSLVSLQHKVENLEATAIDNEDAFMEMKKELTDTRDELAAAKKRMDDLAADKAKLVQHVKTMETERLLLLKSRGITPKRIPQWAVMDECADMAKQLRVWVGSWNLQGKDPFPAMDRERAKRLLKAFIPSGYDMYVLGIQECPNDSLVECADVLLEAEGYRRLTWTINNHNINNYYNSLNSPSDGGNMDPSKLYGKGKDSSLKSLTFLSTAIFVRNKMANDINILAIASEALSGGNDCQGAIAVAVNVFGRIVAVVNSEFDGKSNDTRRDQYQHLFMELGGKLAENSFHMNEQFHHVIWLGDMNHRLVDISGNLLPIDTAVKMLEDGRIMRSLFETHDELNRDKKQQIIFFNYREASPYPNFYPTYRKIRNHGPVDYSSAAWVRNTYLLSEKESFFKGGKLKEYVPGFSDRILYYSMVDLAEDFVPESLPADLEILGDTTMDCTSDQPVRTVINIDNYRSVNDGEGMTVSEHTPVYCTFLLRLRHDHDFTAQNKSNDINSLLSALTIPETPDRSTVPSSPAAPKTPGNGTIAVVAPATPQLTGRSVLGETPPRTPSNRPAPLISVPSRTSLLPLGVYRIRVSGMQLIWGMNQMHPVRASLLFPSPYEVGIVHIDIPLLIPADVSDACRPWLANASWTSCLRWAA